MTEEAKRDFPGLKLLTVTMLFEAYGMLQRWFSFDDALTMLLEQGRRDEHDAPDLTAFLLAFTCCLLSEAADDTVLI